MLSARNLTRKINGTGIWSHLNLDLEKGDQVALRGPSGSGKTLLMRALAGLDDIDDGEIRYKDTPLGEWYIPEYRRHVRYIPQDADFVSGTVNDSIRLFFSFRVYRDLKLDESLLNKYLEILHLPETFLDKTSAYLSGGEKQTVALLRTLLLDPDILLLDEPTSNLDEEMVSRVEHLVSYWMDSGNQHSYLWTSHDTRQLDRMTRRSITLNNNHAI